MAGEVAGVALKEFKEPIRDALCHYSYTTDMRLEFDGDVAATLALTPDKPYLARSETPVTFEGHEVSTLYVLAFAPGDATGSDASMSLSEVDLGDLPAEPKYLPRSKTGIDTEAHLTIASKPLESANQPTLFAGRLLVLGVERGAIKETGHVGQTKSDFNSALRNTRSPRPTVSLTTGYRNGIYLPPGASDQERFGDPHAIFNQHPLAVQVCGFIAIKTEDAARHRRIFEMLGAAEPRSMPQL